ncbi:methyltransferase [Aeoliella sp. ICT_H6.2]|uniref:Methyltransferase n=1 Tax=Aeoliella straminimaris TaxID=2954799 RepID=A0A9X2F6Y7_9BACT|nr:methyltransferase [Aeoliella straminimaris]MCO6042758.1 methyltransferase [Aeoliella straminimaris]
MNNTKKRTMQYQKTFSFDPPAASQQESTSKQQEPEQVARDTSMPPPLVRPDRQIVYDAANPDAWPDAAPLCDHDTITVDRVRTDIDGPAHRFIIKRGDYVEAWFGKDNLHRGIVVGISHARKEVRVRFSEGTEGQWFAVGAIYPCPEPLTEPTPHSVPLSESITQANNKHAPPEGFNDADLVPLPAGPDDVLAHLKASTGKEFAASELRAHFRHLNFDPTAPLDNPVHQALNNLRDRGLVHVEEPRFGEARFSVLGLPESVSKLTRAHCPTTLAGPEVRRLLRANGWTIKAFAERWGFTQKHVRQVFVRGLADQNAVHDWIEASLHSPDAPETPKAEPSTGSTVVEATPTDAVPYTFAEFKELWKRRGQHESFAAYQRNFERVMASRVEILAELQSSYKAPVLKNIAGNLGDFSARSNTKLQNAESIYRKMLGMFLLDGTVRFSMGEKYEDAVASKVRAVTKESFNAHFEELREKQQAYEESISDPQNLADYRKFIDARGEAALTDEQFARWDTLHANMTREQRRSQKPTEVPRFESKELSGVGFTIKEGYHTKRECPLWIVELSTRVERETFGELKAKARMLGGWWSSFRKTDAGFQFLTEDAATKFTELLSGDVDRSDVLADRKAHKEQTTSERLHELANEMLRRSDDTIEQSNQSLQNTARRADIQAGVRGRAFAEAALARTMHSVAEALSRGEAQFLDGVRHRTHIETLDTTLRLARWARVRAIKKTDDESHYDYHLRTGELEQQPIGETDIRFTEYPHPHFYRRHLEDMVRACAGKKGLTMASRRIEKLLRRETRDYVTLTYDSDIKECEDYLTRAKSSGYDVQSVASGFESYRRLQRANIHTVHELRSALREYLPHRAATRSDDPVLVAERELIGRDLPGFFPTPKPVIDQMLELAEIGDGHTVLEPSCGKGDIVTEIERTQPHARITAIERNHTLAEVLAAKGIEAKFADFLEHHGTYDRILMNPPFEKGQDAVHVMHAYSLLAPGGRLVSVMSEGVFGRSDQRSVEFQRWLGSCRGETLKLPEDAFKGADSFRQTGVRTRLVVLNKAS